MRFTAQEQSACRHLLDLALAEDLGDQVDLTSAALVPPDLPGAATLVARAPGVLAGLPAAQMVAAVVDPSVHFTAQKQDSDRVQPGDVLARLAGPMRSILTAERTALNFLQHLSGIASLTRRFVDALAGLPCKLLDTRKTIPGWRLLAKYAVRCGGGHNHRMGLYDGVLIKDNHLRGLQIADVRLQIETAMVRARNFRTPPLPIEIEVETLEQLNVALQCQPTIVLLDNMGPDLLRQAVQHRNAAAPAVLLEASGGVRLDNVRALAATGVDRISVGALTHSAPALDIALDYAL